MPEGGWPAPPDKARLALNRLSQRRRAILRERAQLVVKVPAPVRQQEGSFRWLRHPGATEDSKATWYFDGSMLNGRWKPLRATGFGIAIVAPDGSLLGYGYGTPPHWCRTAAAAEAWALQVVLTSTPFPPSMRTDCLSLLRTAEGGFANASTAKRHLARVWTMIASHLDGRIERLASEGLLVWMPAHLSLSMVGEAKLSDGTRLTTVDWRANRLVDALAKRGAAMHTPPAACIRLLDSAAPAVKHAATLLGAVTHVANNWTVSVVEPDGQTHRRVMRDAEPAPKGKRRKRDAPAAPPPTRQPPRAASCPPPRAWTQPRARSAACLHAARERTEGQARLQQRVAEICSSLSPASNLLTGAERLAALRLRIQGRGSPPP